MKSTSISSLLALTLGISFAPAVRGATVLNYPDFSSVAGLQLNGNAAQAGTVLRVTPSAPNQSGSVFSTSAVTLTSAVSFSTYFSFRLGNPGGISDGDGQGADGLVFVVQTNSSSVGGLGGGLGYSGVPKSVGIEFDTYNNGTGLGDPDGNHVSIDLNGNLASGLASAVPVSTRLNNGSIWYAWVDYDGSTDLLEVRLASSAVRPASALTSTTVDLTTVLLSTNAFVGFTSGTGAGYNDHDVLSWEFRDDFSPVVDPHGVPESGSSLVIMAIGVLALIAGSRFTRKQAVARVK